jgi:hypothetical protein
LKTKIAVAMMLLHLLVGLSLIFALTPSTGPTVENITIITPQVARYEKFEAHFDVTTIAPNLHMPYDANPPAGVEPEIGITVEVEFSPDNWKTIYTQPAFFEQPYNHTIHNGKDHFVPSQSPHWTVRFAPQQYGIWQFRIRAQDASGTTTFPTSTPLTFSVSGRSENTYVNKGFLRVSERDPRYFEFQNGQPFIGLGFNGTANRTIDVAADFADYEEHGINFIRVWLSAAGINGSHWSSWTSHHTNPAGYLPGVHYERQVTYNGADFALKLDDYNPCLFADFWQAGLPAQPNTTYVFEARVKAENITGPAATGPHGFVVKTGGWLNKACVEVNGNQITTPVVGTTDWITVTGTFQTGSNQYWMDNIYLARQNTTAGTVYIHDAKLYAQNDPAQVNLIREPANSHYFFDPMQSAVWDKYIEIAADRGVYLKIVIDEKNEHLRNYIDANGNVTNTFTNNNFYADSDTEVGWLHEAWWRYIIARWGYSTAIHSFEFVNEGDPFHGGHYRTAANMAEYMDENDPAQHMVTTSFWHSYPNREFWSNEAYTAVDYADIHAYVSTGWGENADFIADELVETNPQHIFSGNASARINAADAVDDTFTPNGIVIKEAGEWTIRYWMKMDAISANCTNGSSIRIEWILDGGSQTGTVPPNQNGDTNCTSPDGTFAWTQFSSDKDRNGQSVPIAHRFVVNDNQPHSLQLKIRNTGGQSGQAWIDNVQLVSPSGQVLPVIGEFDITHLGEDMAWSNWAYGAVFGGGSVAGAHKPLVRGETGVDLVDQQEINPAVFNDLEGVWLHNHVWGQINPGGMYEMMWWVDQLVEPNPGQGRSKDLYHHYQTYANFMQGIALNNGRYENAAAIPSNDGLRVWGQRDKTFGNAHLWIQNKQHTWKNVVDGVTITPVGGIITIPDMPAGTYKVDWWDTYAESTPIFHTDIVEIIDPGDLVMTLPSAISDDVAVKLTNTSLPRNYLPMILKTLLPTHITSPEQVVQLEPFCCVENWW